MIKKKKKTISLIYCFLKTYCFILNETCRHMFTKHFLLFVKHNRKAYNSCGLFFSCYAKIISSAENRRALSPVCFAQLFCEFLD